MKTELCYLSDPNLHELRCIVVQSKFVDGLCFVVLDRTPAYPQGGGQPGDSGSLELADGKSISFDKTVRMSDGQIGHRCHTELGRVQQGAEVLVRVNAAQRRLHSRLHTAGELICAAISNVGYGDWKFSAACHFPGQCRVAFQLGDASVDLDQLRQSLSAEIERLIGTGGKVSMRHAHTPEELARLCPVEAGKPFPEWPVRMVSPLDGFFRPCLGTHCDDLSEIAKIELNKIRIKRGEISISYEL